MRPKRTDDKYWTGTRNFNHIQYESDLEDYIIDLENETQQLRKHAVSGRSEQLVCEYCNEDAKPTCCDSCLEGMVNAVQKAN